MDAQAIKSLIRDIPDFPVKGILFKDITPVLLDPRAFSSAVDAMAARCAALRPDALVPVESRGFLFASPIAYKLGIGLAPVRKKGKLPYKTVETSYDLEYGSATLQMHEDALRPGQRVVVVDDLLATGGTAAAAAGLAARLGASVAGFQFLVELAFLDGRARLRSAPVEALVSFA